jgi:hypothetical protein
MVRRRRSEPELARQQDGTRPGDRGSAGQDKTRKHYARGQPAREYAILDALNVARS